MNFAYHIKVHRLPEQFAWLFEAIYDERDLFIIHVDRKSPAALERQLKDHVGDRPNVVFQPRIAAVYSDWSLCELDLQGMRLALKSDIEWSYFINLSGQDYPLKSRAELVRRLSADPARNYVQCKPLTDMPRRFARWKNTLSIRIGNKRYSTFIPTLDPLRSDLRWVGSSWYIVTWQFCDWILADPYPGRLWPYLQKIKMPNEFYMQALIMNGPFRETLVNSHKRLINWRKGAPHPEILTLQDDLEDLLRSDAFFARKFDCTKDAAMLARLREQLRSALA